MTDASPQPETMKLTSAALPTSTSHSRLDWKPQFLPARRKCCWMASCRRFTNRGFIAAILIAAVAMVSFAFVRWYVDTVRALGMRVNRVGNARAKALDDLGKGIPRKKAAQNLMSPNQPTPATDGSVRAVAPATAQVGDVVVGVAAAQVVGKREVGGEERLTLTLRITNLSAKPMKYVSWSQANMSAVLRDHNGNYYNRILLPARSMVVIEPTVTILDTIEFEATPAGVYLELDLKVSGSERSFQFRIPAPSILRVISPPSASAAQPPTPVPPAASDPEKDPRLRSAVRAAYREGMKQVRRTTAPLSPKAAASRQKKLEGNLLKALADQFTLNAEQITRMIGDP